VGDGVGEQAHAGLVGDAGAGMPASSGAQTAGRVSSGSSTTLRCGRFRAAEAVGEEVVLFGGGLGELVARGLMADGEVDLDVAGAGGEGAEIAAGDDGAGEAGLGPVEVELVAGLAAGEGGGMGRALRAAGEDLHALGTRMCISAVKRSVMKPVSGEPAAGIEQVGDGFLDGGQLEAFDGAVFIAGDGAVVVEGPMVGLAGGEGRRG
jgi:hypothetical protein